MTGEEPTERTVDHHGSVRGQVIAGVIVFGFGAAATWVLGLLAEAKAPIWWYVLGIAAAALVATLVFPPWRHGVWGNIAKWRPFTTKGTLERAKEAGRAEALADRKQHKPSTRAQWMVHKPKEESDKPYTWAIMNMAGGSTAKAVSIHVSPSEFKVGSALDWDEIPGETMKNFRGGATSDGQIYGVDFLVTWTNEHGERLSSTIPWKGRGSF